MYGAWRLQTKNPRPVGRGNSAHNWAAAIVALIVCLWLRQTLFSVWFPLLHHSEHRFAAVIPGAGCRWGTDLDYFCRSYIGAGR